MDTGMEMEVMMFDNNPTVNLIYMSNHPQSIWIMREVNEASRRIKKIFREALPGPRTPVLVLVGTKQQFSKLSSLLPKQEESESV